MRTPALGAALLFALSVLPAPAGDKSAKPKAGDIPGYEVRKMQGFKVAINHKVLEQPTDEFPVKPLDVLEGEFPGYLIVIGFPTRAQAEGWYASPAYREILPLRLEHSTGPVILVDGVDADHRAVDVLP